MTIKISRVDENYSVSPQIHRDDIAALKDLGFRTIICNRPDHEEPAQPLAEDIRDACQQLAIGFHHIPVATMPIDEHSIAAQKDAITASDGPVLAYCRSGQRSLIIWQAIA